MAYSKLQRRQHIAELQKYLYSISLFNSNIPHIMIDGFYGKETIEAVKAFQREYGLPETGNTDSATWNKIVRVYKEHINSEPSGYKAFPSKKHIVRLGDNGTLVYIIQVMLNNIANKFDNAPHIEINGNYNNETANAVKMFRQRVGLPYDDIVDSTVWNMLVGFNECIDRMI
ncbi:MAG TPA: peptidoglycan-binding domain-containing protein [Ruminococcus sp.]